MDDSWERTVHTTDVDVARQEVAGIFCPHRLTPLDHRLSVGLRSRRVGGIGVSRLDYGAAVRIEPGLLESFYLVQMPRSGTALITQGGEEISSTVDLASVVSPDDALSMVWGPGNPQDIFYVGRQTLEECLARLLGHPPGSPVRFRLGMRIRDGAPAAWFRAFEALRREIAQDSPLLSLDSVAAGYEQLLVTQLLMAQPSNYSDLLLRVGPASPRGVARARRYLDTHYPEPLTVGQVAEAMGMSSRALQKGFQDHLGVSPMQYLMERRLQCAREALRAGHPDRTTVTEVALQSGFSHLSRFASRYRHRFGESPSATLRAR